MLKYINAKNLKRCFAEKYPEWLTLNMINETIDEQPAADVEEVRYGEWIDDANGSTYVNGEKVIIKVCSACGNANPFNALGDPYYPARCDRCGAKMDGGKNDTGTSD